MEQTLERTTTTKAELIELSKLARNYLDKLQSMASVHFDFESDEVTIIYHIGYSVKSKKLSIGYSYKKNLRILHSVVEAIKNELLGEFKTINSKEGTMEQSEEKKLETFNSPHEGYAYITESLEDFWVHAKGFSTCDSWEEELESIQCMEVYLQGLIKKANITLNTLRLMRREIFEKVEQYQNKGVIN